MQNRILSIGETYTHNSHRKFILKILMRGGPIILAYNPEYGYEVFKVRIRKEKKWDNSTIPAGEYPPASSEFGKMALHFPPKYLHLAVKEFMKLFLEYNVSKQNKTKTLPTE